MTLSREMIRCLLTTQLQQQRQIIITSDILFLTLQLDIQNLRIQFVISYQ